MAKKKTKVTGASKAKPKPARTKRAAERTTIVLRLPSEVVGAIDRMAAEVFMSRNSLAALILSQAAAMHRAQEADPTLFDPTEQLIEAALKRAMKGGK